jgi:chromosome segregation ATPase
MRTSLSTPLLIALVISLSGLSAYQWLRESKARSSLQTLRDTQQQLESEIHQHTNQSHRTSLRLAEVTGELARFEELVRSNAATILGLQTDLNSTLSTNQLLTAQVVAFTNAFAQATNQLSQAYTNIQAQNQRIQEIVAQRDGFVAQLNTAIAERNQVVAQYNDLVRKFEDLQQKLKLPTELLRP